MQRESRVAHYVVGTLTALSLILLSLPLSSPVRSFKACVSYVLDPLSYSGEKGYQKLASVPSRVKELLSADIENKRLQDELRRMSWLKTKFDRLNLENERLRHDLGLKGTPGRSPIWASVIDRDPQRWYSSIAVDAGEDAGVSLSDPVLARKDDGLVVVGRVVEVRSRTSTVLLLTDERSAVAAYLSSGTIAGLVQGQASNPSRLLMNYIDSEARVMFADSVYTSPTSAVFPPDVMIGRIVQVARRDQFLSMQSVEVSPAFASAALQEVVILRGKPGAVRPALSPVATASDSESAAATEFSR